MTVKSTMVEMNCVTLNFIIAVSALIIFTYLPESQI